MQITRARPLAGGVQSLMYVGDVPGTTTTIDVGELAVGAGLLWLAFTGRSGTTQTLAGAGAAYVLWKAVRR